MRHLPVGLIVVTHSKILLFQFGTSHPVEGPRGLRAPLLFAEEPKDLLHQLLVSAPP